MGSRIQDFNVLPTSSSKSQDSNLVIVIVAAALSTLFLMISAILIFLMVRRHRTRTQVPTKETDILQYSTQEPRYVSSNLVKANIVTNPYHENLMKHDHYSTTFDRVDPHYPDPGMKYPLGTSQGSPYEPQFQTYYNAKKNVPTHQPNGLLVIDPKSHYEDPVSFL